MKSYHLKIKFSWFFSQGLPIFPKTFRHKSYSDSEEEMQQLIIQFWSAFSVNLRFFISEALKFCLFSMNILKWFNFMEVTWWLKNLLNKIKVTTSIFLMHIWDWFSKASSSSRLIQILLNFAWKCHADMASYKIHFYFELWIFSSRTTTF